MFRVPVGKNAQFLFKSWPFGLSAALITGPTSTKICFIQKNKMISKHNL